MPEHILIVEDEPKIARFLELELQHEGYTVTKTDNGRDALSLMDTNSYDLLLLDIMLPGLNGLEVLRRIRRMSDIPVIAVTARDSVMDKVAALDMGADDYITKPFAIEELLARIRRALSRQQSGAASEVLRCGPLELSVPRHEAVCCGTPVSLTGREFSLLETLMRNKDIVLSRETLLQQVWGYDYFGDTNVVDVYIRYLRSKVDIPHGITLIHTIRGVGYVIRDPDSAQKAGEYGPEA